MKRNEDQLKDLVQLRRIEHLIGKQNFPVFVSKGNRHSKNVLNLFLSTRIAVPGQSPLLKVFKGSIIVLNGLNMLVVCVFYIPWNSVMDLRIYIPTKPFCLF